VTDCEGQWIVEASVVQFSVLQVNKMSSFMLLPLRHNINNIAAIFESNGKKFSGERSFYD
jgi:hypothetical protein